MKTIFMCLLMLCVTASSFASGSEVAKNKLPDTEVMVATADLATVNAVTESDSFCYRFDVAEVVYADETAEQEQMIFVSAEPQSAERPRPEIVMLN